MLIEAKVATVNNNPRDPSIHLIPTLGPKVGKCYLHWAIFGSLLASISFSVKFSIIRVVHGIPRVRIQKTTMAYDSKIKLSLIIARVSVRVRVGVIIITIVIVILMRIIAIVLISILDDSEQNTHALNKIDFPCQNTIVLSLDTKEAS